MRSYVDALRQAKTDPRIDSVLVMPTAIESPYWGKCRKSGTRCSISGNPGSAFLRIWSTAVSVSTTCDGGRPDLPRSDQQPRRLGGATYAVFLKGTLDKLGASADFEKIGDYKTAPNQLTERRSPLRIAR